MASWLSAQENSWGSQASSETDRQNALLQKAIYAYLDKCVKQTYSQAQLELTELGAEEKLRRDAEWKVEQYEVDSNGKRTDNGVGSSRVESSRVESSRVESSRVESMSCHIIISFLALPQGTRKTLAMSTSTLTTGLSPVQLRVSTCTLETLWL